MAIVLRMSRAGLMANCANQLSEQIHSITHANWKTFRFIWHTSWWNRNRAGSDDGTSRWIRQIIWSG